MSMIDQVVPNQPPAIIMSQEQKDKWLTALRSGEYKQAIHTLHDEKTGGYCCLGVLQKIISGDVSRSFNGESCGAPDFSWLEENHIKFFESDRMHKTGNPAVHVFIEDETYDSAHHWSYTTTSVAELNDTGASFEQIADVLEKIIEVRA